MKEPQTHSGSTHLAGVTNADIDRSPGRVCANPRTHDIGSWAFNILGYAQRHAGPLLPALTAAIFARFNFHRAFGITPGQYQNFAAAANRLYRDNPFHNATHAADVLQCAYFIIARCGMRRYLDDQDILAVLICAITHDLDHPGVNNLHLQASNDPLYQAYPRSTLECHHAQLTLALLRDANHGLLSGLSESAQQQLREKIAHIILATDVQNSDQLKRNFAQTLEAAGTDPKNWRAKERNLLLLQVLMHASDISNSGRPAPVNKYWARCIHQEVRHQEAIEEQKGITIPHPSHECGLTLGQNQFHFISHSVLPLYEHLATLLPKTAIIVSNLKKNRDAWVVEDPGAGL